MGIYAEYYGDMTIPPKKRQEFSERMITLLREGGMMNLETVQLYGQKIGLLCTPSLEQEKINVWYNYFENNSWESIIYTTSDEKIESGRLGCCQFSIVASAAYLLFEFYTQSFGLAIIGDMLLPAKEIIGWFNYLFREKYTNQRAADLWKIYCHLGTSGFTDISPSEMADLLEEIPSECADLNAVVIYSRVYHTQGFPPSKDSLEESESEGFEPRKMILTLQNNIHLWRQSEIGTDDEKVKKIKSIFRLLKDEDIMDHMKVETKSVQDLIIQFLQQPREVGLKVISLEFHLDYWTLLEEMSDVQYLQLGYEPYADPQPCPPEEPVPTTQFLNCSDDDRAYFWEPDGDVKFSDEMQLWIKKLATELDEIICENNMIRPELANKNLTAVLKECEERYYSVFMFQETFYEFLSKAGDNRVQSAVVLLQRLSDRYCNDRNQGRMKLRRYLAILGNPELRQHVFEF